MPPVPLSVEGYAHFVIQVDPAAHLRARLTFAAPPFNCTLVSDTEGGKKKSSNISTLLFRSESLDVPQVLQLLFEHWSMAKTIASGGQAFAVQFVAPTLDDALTEMVTLAKAAEEARGGREKTRIHLRVTPRSLLAKVLKVGEAPDVDLNFVTHSADSDLIFTLHKVDASTFCYALVPPSHDIRRLIPPFCEEKLGYPTNGVPRASRAFMKLKEVCECGEDPVCLDPSWVALDVGASPGGWTQYLAERCARVVAVDPGAINEEILALPNVTHLAGMTERMHKEMKELGPEAGYNIIVSDINADPVHVSKILLDIMEFLAPDAVLVLTLKLPTNSKKGRDRMVAKSRECLQPLFRVKKVVQLWSNTTHETTLVAERVVHQPRTTVL